MDSWIITFFTVATIITVLSLAIFVLSACISFGRTDKDRKRSGSVIDGTSDRVSDQT